MMLPLLVFLVIVLWSSSHVVVGLLVDSVNPWIIASLRFFVASVIFLIIRLGSVKQDIIHLFGILKYVVMAGFLGIFSYNVLINFGQTRIDPTTTSFLINTVPVFTLFGAYICGWERINFLKLFSVLICLIGVGVIAFSKGIDLTDWTFFSFLIIGASICLAAYFLIIKFISLRLSPVLATVGAVWSGSILLFIFSITKIMNHTFTLEELFLLFYLGVGPSTFGFLIWSYVLKKMDAGIASIFLFLIPLTVFIMEYIAFATMPSKVTLVGCLIVLLGLVFLKHREIRCLVFRRQN